MATTLGNVSTGEEIEALWPFLSPEDLADALDDGNARRNWFLNLYVERQVALIERGVSRVLAKHEIQDGMYRPQLAEAGKKGR